MKYILSISMLLFVTLSSFSQTISPLLTNEYCPNTNITFTVTIPGYSPFVYGWTNNPTVISANYPPANPAASTTFSFIGSFKDIILPKHFK